MMSTQESDLTSIGYNLSCAVTQDAINETMLFYLEELQGEIDYVETSINGQISTETLGQFVDSCGIDPFSIPNGTTVTVFDFSNQSNLTQDQKNLIAVISAGFKTAIKAVTGVNEGWTTTPNMVELNDVGTYVTFNMFFASMQIACYETSGTTYVMQNITQPDNEPWIFTWLVNLADADATGDPGAPPLPDDQSGLFSVQRLFLDLTTLVNGITPTIIGLCTDCVKSATAEVANYVKSIPPNSSTVSYVYMQTQGVEATEESTSTITVTTLQYAVMPNETTPGLGTLNYLCMTGTDQPPSKIVYPTWNWVSSGESISGVMAIERGVFISYLTNAFNTGFSGLSVQTKGQATWTDQWNDCKGNFKFSYVLNPSDAAVWTEYADTTSTTLATATYTRDDGDSGNQHSYSDWCTCGSISCYWHYDLSGSITFANNSDGTVLITMTLGIQSRSHAHLCGDTKEANVIVLGSTMTYALSVLPTGEIDITPTQSQTNNSEKMGSLKTTCGAADETTYKGLTDALNYLVPTLEAQLKSYESVVLDALRTSLTWFFPGTSTFSFSDIAFSNYGDFVVNITYAKPTTGGAGNPGVTQS
jgi:hypothetical protein